MSSTPVPGMSAQMTDENTETFPVEEVVAQLDGKESTSTTAPEAAADASETPPSDPNLVDLDPAASEASEEATSDTPASGTSEVLEMIESLGYKDPKSFVKGLHESWQSSKKLHQENLELRDQILASAEESTASEPDPDVTFHEENITSLKSKVQSVVGQETAFLQQIAQLNEQKAEKKGELRNVDDSERPGLEATIDRLENKIDNLSDKWAGLVSKKTDIGEDIRKEERALGKAQKEAEKSLQDLRNQRQQQQEAEKVFADSTREQFEGTVGEILTEKGVPSKAQKTQKEAIRGMLLAHLRALGPEAQTQDIPSLTKTIGEAYLESLDVMSRHKFTKASTAKVASAKQTVSREGQPPSPPAQPNRKARRDMSQDDWDAQLRAAQDHFGAIR